MADGPGRKVEALHRSLRKDDPVAKNDSHSVQPVVARQRSNPGGWAGSGSLRRFSPSICAWAETHLTRRNSTSLVIPGWSEGPDPESRDSQVRNCAP
ncbi:hypothetical protein NK6_6276 [Bradyrhizobium diazoefficiens]|uniref:Uncharacterized protein n=1 Tax=Bradyrhizobium diazoefficiens TaxID=1355477 RepID=A0A0E4BSZ3_9BRAD|nr:hypothetical protein NK6_6276 [Bradyrhizobium diazoefficiens]